jgi:hypothetical protein
MQNGRDFSGRFTPFQLGLRRAMIAEPDWPTLLPVPQALV